ncbi:MAG TPA: DNA mismatch repair protein MutS [Chthoniobacter sp.]|jgi:adenosyl cobinamide kinase/adenosyl cobinamide phosphate guanylyltransferase
MKTHLLFRDRDFDWDQPLPANHEALVQDLSLGTVLNGMSGGDEYIQEVSKRVMLANVGDDIETIFYRQAVLKDCLQNGAVIGNIYNLAVDANERKRKQWFGVLSKSPGGVLSGAVELLQVLMDILGKLRVLAREHGRKFQSEGFVTLFKMIEAELPDDYFEQVKTYLRELKFPEGVLVSAELGENMGAAQHTLRRATKSKPKFFQRVFSEGPPSYSFKINDKDDAGAKAIAELRDRGINVVANAVSQSAEHIMSFFAMLRAEVGFYIGSANLYSRLSQQGQPLCFPTPAPIGSRKHSCTELRDASLALTVGTEITGNDLRADGKDLFLITGANQGGKSTFLRAAGLAQIMMQCGMFVTAQAFNVALCRHIHTHYTREEDVTMKSGKFDEELRRMSAIVDALTPDSILFFNESFAATNEREGSEIGRQIVKALLEARVKVFFVTHLYELSHGFWKDNMPNSLFLRAERQAGGKRTFKLLPGEPLQTSFGADLFQEIFDGKN